MTKQIIGLSRDLIIHPGETLREMLAEQKITQQELARKLNLSAKHVSEILNGKASITPAVARNLEAAFPGVSAMFWLNMQNNYDLELLEFKERKSSNSKNKTKYSALNIAEWFLSRSNDELEGAGITHLKLQKLLYFAQGVFMADKGYPLFNEDFYAWDHGPVIKEIYQEYKKCGAEKIESIKNIKLNDSSTEKILEYVYQNFGQYTAWKLRDMTHNEGPYNATKKDEMIPKLAINDYFEKKMHGY